LIEFETVDPSFMNGSLYIQAPPEAGEYIYELRLNFKDSGIVNYGFVVRVDMISYDLSEISKYKTPYVGDSSKVTHIADLLPVPDNYFKHQYISIKSNNKPYNLTIYYEPAADMEYEGEWPITKPGSVIETNSRTNALVVFSMIDNLDEVTFAFFISQSDGELDDSKYNTTYTFQRAAFEKKHGDLSMLGNDIVLLEDLLAGKESAMKGLELYVWRDPELTGNNNLYYTLLMGTNRNKSRSEVYDMDIATSDLDIIKQELSRYSSGTYLFIMHDIDIDKETMIRIGDDLTGIIKNASLSIGSMDFNDRLTVDTEIDKSFEFVEDNLTIIMSSPKESSNPIDYIKAHQNEYENIIKYGNEEVLEYLLSQFENNNVEGLRGQLIMRICKELLGQRNNVIDESLSPMEWFMQLDMRQEIILPDFSYDGTDLIEKL
ncbi:MAG: DUF4825 domain-containing protein, partial [Clostridiales bacterium]|nr:DUF4825 domain-containing protein [Clostridiales bacterium]